MAAGSASAFEVIFHSIYSSIFDFFCCGNLLSFSDFLLIYFCGVLNNQVGSYFITKYYHVLKESPEYSHQFYNNSSTLTRVDGDDTQTVSTILVMIFLSHPLFVFVLFKVVK